MPQRLLLEGPDIDELLARVRAEHGPNAQIVHAEQRLVGGFAGFFARRRYELSVQVDDGPSGHLTSSAVPAIGSLRAPSASVHAEAVESRPIAATSMADLLQLADRADVAVVSSASCASAGPAGSSASGEPAPVGLLAREQRGSSSGATAPTGRRLSTDSPEFERLLNGLVARTERAETSVAAGRSGPVSRPVADEARLAAADDGSDLARRTLKRLGLPDALVPDRPVADPRIAVLDVLTTAAAHADERLWGTTVVIGTPDLAARTVALLLARSGCSTSDVLTTSSDAACSAEVAVQASAITSVRGAAVVVIETAATRVAARQAGRLAAGLGLGTVVVALDGVRDLVAQQEWLAALAEGGRAATCAAVFDVAESPTPLALLGLGPDICWVDGRPASVGAWAAPCLDRLSEGQA